MTARCPFPCPMGACCPFHVKLQVNENPGRVPWWQLVLSQGVALRGPGDDPGETPGSVVGTGWLSCEGEGRGGKQDT